MIEGQVPCSRCHGSGVMWPRGKHPVPPGQDRGGLRFEDVLFLAEMGLSAEEIARRCKTIRCPNGVGLRLIKQLCYGPGVTPEQRARVLASFPKKKLGRPRKGQT